MSDLCQNFCDRLDEKLCLALTRQGINAPLRIQQEMIPRALSGDNLLVTSPTGSGKTLAYLLPIIQKILSCGWFAEAFQVSAIIVSPTRELATQIERVATPLCRAVNFRLLGAAGGHRLGGKKKAIQKGLDVLVATPGRLKEMIDSKSISLEATQIVVMDEADELIGRGFIEELRSLSANLGSNCQYIFCSATMPATVIKLAGEFAQKFYKLRAQCDMLPPVGAHIHHFFIDIPVKGRLASVLEMMSAIQERILIFANTRERAEKMFHRLKKADRMVELLHGGQDQHTRNVAIRKFRETDGAVLIATDVAARGLDVKKIDLLVNYDFPISAEIYIHRAGRCARNAGAGKIMSFMDANNPKEVEMLDELKTVYSIHLSPAPIRAGIFPKMKIVKA